MQSTLIMNNPVLDLMDDLSSVICCTFDEYSDLAEYLLNHFPSLWQDGDLDPKLTDSRIVALLYFTLINKTTPKNIHDIINRCITVISKNAITDGPVIVYIDEFYTFTIKL